MIVASATLATPAQIGARVQYFRRKKGLSLDVAAGLTGISPSYLARLEGGKRQFNRRGLLETLALVVGCSVTDLTDPDADPKQAKPTPAHSGQSVAKPNPAAEAVIPQIQTALYDCTLDDVPDLPCRPVTKLVTAARRANERRMEAGRYEELTGLGPLLTKLQVAVATTTDGAERLAALAALVEALMVAEDVANTFGSSHAGGPGCRAWTGGRRAARQPYVDRFRGLDSFTCAVDRWCPPASRRRSHCGDRRLSRCRSHRYRYACCRGVWIRASTLRPSGRAHGIGHHGTRPFW